MPKIIAFPSAGIAYNDSLYAEFRAQGAVVQDGGWYGRWLVANVSAGDVVHIHWPSFFYESQGAFHVILNSFGRFLFLLAIVRFKTRNIWWTAHNLMPHARCRIAALDRIARIAIIHASRRIFVHGAEARKMLVTDFPAASGKTVLIPHGNWIGHYPQGSSRSEARQKLRLPEKAFIYLLFGACRPYKNLEGLIDSFRNIATNEDTLLIAGRFDDEGYRAKIFDLASGNDRIRIDEGYVSDEMVSEYLLACNALCIPYREILTSGSAMLALSYGRPVLSINRGFLRDVVRDSCGLLVDPGDSGALEDGLRAMRVKAWNEAEILRTASLFTFSDAARISLSCLGEDEMRTAGSAVVLD